MNQTHEWVTADADMSQEDMGIQSFDSHTHQPSALNTHLCTKSLWKTFNLTPRRVQLEQRSYKAGILHLDA